MSRIEELRALRKRVAEAESEYRPSKVFDSDGFMKYSQARSALDDASVKSIDALLDCAEALRWLLQDTQHAEHECSDETCPVAAARTALARLNGVDQ